MKDKEKSDNAFGQYVRNNLIGKESEKPFKSISAMARALGMSRQYLHLLLSGEHEISPATATQLGKLTKEDPSTYLKLSRKDYSDDFLYPKNADDLISMWKKSGSRHLVDIDIKRAYEVGLLKIEPFNVDCIQSASIDLRIGEKITIHLQGRKYNIQFKEEKTHLLQPNAIADIETLEQVNMPSCMLGVLGSMTPLCANHIQLLYGAFCDPGYNNPLMLSIKNIGFTEYKLAWGHPIVTMGLVFLPTPVEVASSGENAYQHTTIKTNQVDINNPSLNNNHTPSKYSSLSIENIYEKLETDYKFAPVDINKILVILNLNEDDNQVLTGAKIMRKLKECNNFNTNQILNIIDVIMGSH